MCAVGPVGVHAAHHSEHTFADPHHNVDVVTAHGVVVADLDAGIAERLAEPEGRPVAGGVGRCRRRGLM